MAKAKIHVGDELVNNKGQKFTILKIANKLATVRFEDGEIVTKFVSAVHKRSLSKNEKEVFVGYSYKVDGHKWTVIKVDYNDVTIQDERGRQWTTTVKGVLNRIKPPAIITGDKFITNKCGVLEVIDFIKKGWFLVKFEDGTTREARYSSIVRGNVLNPNQPMGIDEHVEALREKYIQDCCDIYNNFYSYEFLNYSRQDNKVEVTCPIHRNFMVDFNRHRDGTAGCPNCLTYSRRKTDGFKVYVMVSENFTKIGITSREISKRVKDLNRCGHSYEAYCISRDMTYGESLIAEKQLIEYFVECGYLQPDRVVNGYTETFIGLAPEEVEKRMKEIGLTTISCKLNQSLI